MAISSPWVCSSLCNRLEAKGWAGGTCGKGWGCSLLPQPAQPLRAPVPRVDVCGDAMQHLGKSPLFGAYYEISDGTGTRHMHNSHLDIAASYGLPVLVMVCVLLVRCLHQQGRIYKNKKEYIFILSFACSVLLGVGEAAVFSGGLGLYIMAGASLLLANKRDEAVPGGV